MSAAYCSVRVTAGCGRPSAVQTKGTMVNAQVGSVYDQRLPALRLLELLLRWSVYTHPGPHCAAWMRGLAAMSAPRCAGPAMCRSFLYPIPEWPALSVRLLRTVLRESREEALKRSLSNLVMDFSSPFFLQDCVAMHPEDVVDTANATAFVRILAQLNTLLHSSSDICFGRELIRNEFTAPHSNPKRSASSRHCETEASSRTSSNLHSNWAASRSAS